MDAEEWKRFSQVFNLDVNVKVKKKVDRSDIIKTLVNEGEFIFKGKNGNFTQMNIKMLEGMANEEQIKLFKELIWNPVEEFIKKVDANAVKQDLNLKNNEVKECP